MNQYPVPEGQCGYAEARGRVIGGFAEYSRGSEWACPIGGCGLRAVVEIDTSIVDVHSTANQDTGSLIIVRKDANGNQVGGCPRYEDPATVDYTKYF